MDIRHCFGLALKTARRSRGLTQEDFSVVSSTNLISLIENGKTSPTLQKLDAICSNLNAHPASLLVIAYLLKDSSDKDSSDKNIDDLLTQVRREVIEIMNYKES